MISKRVHASMAMCLAITVSLSSSACSFVFAKGPPEQHHTMASFDCTSGRTLPTLDTIFAVSQVIRTGVALSASDEDYEGASLSRGADIGLGVVLGSLGVISAVHGHGVVNRCRAAKDAATPHTNEQTGWMPTQTPPPLVRPVRPVREDSAPGLEPARVLLPAEAARAMESM